MITRRGLLSTVLGIIPAIPAFFLKGREKSELPFQEAHTTRPKEDVTIQLSENKKEIVGTIRIHNKNAEEFIYTHFKSSKNSEIVGDFLCLSKDTLVEELICNGYVVELIHIDSKGNLNKEVRYRL